MKDKKLESVFKIDGKEVEKEGQFLGFDLYIHTDVSVAQGTVTTFFVKEGKVLGESQTEYYGGSRGSASGEVSFYQY